MERLTCKAPSGHGWVWAVKTTGVHTTQNVIDRLAAYEDIGWEPEKLKALVACWSIFESAAIADMDAALGKAIEDLHFVMRGGNPCEVCARKCEDGDGTCKPVWRGEKELEAQEGEDKNEP